MVNVCPTSWIIDTNSSLYITSNLGCLVSTISYSQNEGTLLGNGAKIPTDSIGTTKLIVDSNCVLSLKNFLYTPSTITNLLSVNKLCVDNKVSLEFDS